MSENSLQSPVQKAVDIITATLKSEQAVKSVKVNWRSTNWEVLPIIDVEFYKPELEEVYP